MPGPLARLTLVLFAAAALGCSSDATGLVVTVSARDGVRETSALMAVFSQQSERLTQLLQPSDSAARFFGAKGPNSTRFVIHADGWVGPVTVEVTARDPSDQPVGRGSATATLSDKQLSQTVVTLDPLDNELNQGEISQRNEFFSTGAQGRQIASASNGRFVAVWRNECPQSGVDCTIFTRLFDNLGMPQLNHEGSANELIASEKGKSYDMPAVAMQPSGAFVIAYKQIPANVGGPGHVFARSFLDTAAPATNDQQLSSGDDTENPDVAALAGNAGYVVVWEQIKKGTPTRVEIVARLLDLGGKPIRSPIAVGSYDQPSITASACSATSPCPAGGECKGGTCAPASARPAVGAGPAGGTFMIVWRKGGNVYGRTYTGDKAASGEIKVSAAPTGSVGSIDVAGVPTGYAVVWDDIAPSGGDTDGRSIRLRRLTLAGGALDSDFTINTTVQGNQTEPTIAATRRGQVLNNVLVVWHSTVSPGDAGGGIRGRRFLPNGLPIGNDLPINSTTPDAQTAPSIAPHGDESFVVGFVDKSATGKDRSGTAIRGRIVYPGYGTRDGKVGALCDGGANRCASDLACLKGSSQVGNRCVTTCDKPGSPCLLGGTCVQPTGGAKAVCLFTQPP